MDEKVYELAEIIDRDLAEGNLGKEERKRIAEELKPYMSPNSVVLAQANPISGDVKYNAQKAQRWINWANLLGVKAIIFPEMFLIGYPIGDFIDRFPIVVEECNEWLEAIAKLTGKTKVIIGDAEFKEGKFGKD